MLVAMGTGALVQRLVLLDHDIGVDGDHERHLGDVHLRGARRDAVGHHSLVKTDSIMAAWLRI